MMDLLHITSLRPGRNGSNPQAPNSANYDESKANPYPDAARPADAEERQEGHDGEGLVDEAAAGDRRGLRPRDLRPRAEGHAQGEVGSRPATTNETNGDVPVIVKQLVGHVDNSAYPPITVDIQLTLTTPAKATGPGAGDHGVRLRRLRAGRGPATGRAARTGAARRADLAAAGARQGLGLRDPRPEQHPGGQRRGADAGDHRAGETRASRASRTTGARCGPGPGAPAARWITSRPTRPWTPSRSASKATRATARRRSWRWPTTSASPSRSSAPRARAARSCTAATAASWWRTSPAPNEYHWMAGNFLKYAGPLNWNDLPVDSHELIALCAPRPVFISAGAHERRRLGGREGHVPGRRGRRSGVPAARQEGPGHDRVSADRDGADRRRRRVPAAQRRAHAGAELADVHSVCGAVSGREMSMRVTRRSLLVAAAASSVARGATLTAGQVIDRIKANVGIPWRATTVDNLIAGTPETPVHGIATTMMATLDVVRRAAAAGRNMIVTHEPTYYSHQDRVDALTRGCHLQVQAQFSARARDGGVSLPRPLARPASGRNRGWNDARAGVGEVCRPAESSPVRLSRDSAGALRERYRVAPEDPHDARGGRSQTAR